jgi:hypothetical protein
LCAHLDLRSRWRKLMAQDAPVLDTSPIALVVLSVVDAVPALPRSQPGQGLRTSPYSTRFPEAWRRSTHAPNPR